MMIKDLFNKFKRNASEVKPLSDRFKQWLDPVLGNNIPSDVAALIFNIYQDIEKRWSVEVVGTSFFDEDDDDWACKDKAINSVDEIVVIIEDGFYKTLAKLLG